MVLGRRVGTALLALVVLLTSACSNDDAPSTASLGSPAPKSSASASSPPSSSTDSSSSDSPCRAEAPPASAVRVTRAEGDFDGDGASDTATVYGTGTATQPSPYHLHIELANERGRVDAAIVDAATDDSSTVKVLGGAELSATAGLPPDGSGAEVFVQVGSGASAALVGVYQLRDCTLTRLVGPLNQQPSLFAIGGSVTHLDGLRCDGASGGQRLVVLSATSDDGITYKATETRLQVEADHFNSLEPATSSTVDASDPRLRSFSNLDCPGVQSP